MPLFELRCDSCEAVSEQLVLAGDVDSRPVCPSCGSQKLSRLLSTFAARADAGASRGFDPSTACGGGACRMPDVCGSRDVS